MVKADMYVETMERITGRNAGLKRRPDRSRATSLPDLAAVSLRNRVTRDAPIQVPEPSTFDQTPSAGPQPAGTDGAPAVSEPAGRAQQGGRKDSRGDSPTGPATRQTLRRQSLEPQSLDGSLAENLRPYEPVSWGVLWDVLAIDPSK